MKKKIKAIIDLGSLKAKLTVFDITTIDVVSQKSYLTLLGKNLSDRGSIAGEALIRLDESLTLIKDELEKLSCYDIKFIATESLRLAENKESVYEIVQKYFPDQTVTILNQELEGEMFFRVVSSCFAGRPIVAMDVGGGSVQIFHGVFDSNKNSHSIRNKYLYKTGTYRLQQKYSPDNSVISHEFERAIDDIKQEIRSLSVRNDVLIFGSTCMQDFLKESGIKLYTDMAEKKHQFYTTTEDLKFLLSNIRQFAPNNRNHFYPSGEYFVYGADYLLANVVEVAEKLGARYIYPTNMNSSYGFI